MQQWDVIVSVALMFTGIVTPYEVAFLGTEINTIFFINRFIDLLFVKDMLMAFFLMYEECTRKGRQFVRDHRKIVLRYIKSWFFIDLVSIIPFDLLSMVLNSGAFQKLKVLRTIRVLRLLKLVRVLRASRILKRWEASMSVSYAYLAMFKFGILMWISAHWGACCWGLTGRMQEDSDSNWIAALRSNKGGPEEGDNMGLYWACLHFALMTLTSIGYGDIVPMNTVEYAVCCCLMACGGVAWAYIIGNFCGLIATLNIQDAAFRQTIDDLNHMMDERGIPNDLRRRLRTYFHQSKDTHRAENYRKLMDRMSPLLQTELAKITNHHWICKVWYFKRCSERFMAHLALGLRSHVYIQSEEIRLTETLGIVTRGLVSLRGGRVQGNGAVLGVELLIQELHAPEVVILALTFVELHQLQREKLKELLAEFPGDAKMVRRSVVKVLIVEGILKQLKEAKKGNEDPRDYESVLRKLVEDRQASIELASKQKSTEARLAHIEENVTGIQKQMDLLTSTILKELGQEPRQGNVTSDAVDVLE
jgi:hypothetical protein